MKPTVSETKVLLEWASQPCMCESYYSYTCSKHKDVGAGFLTRNKDIIDFCLAEGLVVWDSYSSLKTTRLGWEWAHHED